MGFMDNFTSDSPVKVKQPDYYIDDKNMTIAQVESTMNQIKEIMEEIKE